ncbi:MAG TPA: acetate/propionate family kinase, partial [Roseibacterium sp.]|nr:acetate/propionate family kinase [Roseibacterium sp.]
AALQHILNWLEQLPSQYHVIAVGHRVVHGGMYFSQPRLVDTSILTRLRALIPLAPLHQPQALRAIDHLLSLRPRLAQTVCFDTAFHASMPMTEQLFALPRELAAQGIRRYGFHGLSYEYIASVLPDHLGERAEGRVVVAHLGHGVSLCAMHQRKSVATTMSFTPLDGLPMASRCGAIDAAVVLYLLRERGMTVDEVSDLLHHQSGLLGLSGISGDMRTLLASNSQHAAEAIALFIQRVHRELGSLAAALGGLDALVFTGGIGEHAAPVRAAICNAAAWLGIVLDENANCVHAGRISTDDSRVSVWVIPTDEEQLIARHTASLLGNRAG